MTSTRQVRFEYCISLIVLTWRRESEVVAIGARQKKWFASLPYCLITLLFGWWGLPWGFVLSPIVIWRNLKGGRPVLDGTCDEPV